MTFLSVHDAGRNGCNDYVYMYKKKYVRVFVFPVGTSDQIAYTYKCMCEIEKSTSDGGRDRDIKNISS